MRQVEYTIGVARKYPEAVALVVTWDDQQKRANIITIGWHMTTSFAPPMWAVSIGNNRYSHATLSASREFVLAFPHAGQQRSLLYCGSRSGRKVDKFQTSGFIARPAIRVKAPLIEDACANYECRVTAIVPTGDHTVFVGEVLAAHVAEHQHPRVFINADGSFASLSSDAG